MVVVYLLFTSLLSHCLAHSTRSVRRSSNALLLSEDAVVMVRIHLEKERGAVCVDVMVVVEYVGVALMRGPGS